jgi:hypothetical protein
LNFFSNEDIHPTNNILAKLPSKLPLPVHPQIVATGRHFRDGLKS